MRAFHLAPAVLLTCASLCFGAAAKADTIDTSIGTQHFTNGQTGVKSGPFNTAVMGQPAPFNEFCGSVSASNCSATWTFDYTIPVGDTITGATLTLGILDIESTASGSPVGSFTLDGTDDLTSLLNTAADATNSVLNEYNVLEINIPGADFTDLSNGMATFALTLSGPGLGTLGTTPFHPAGLDFSSLDITATPGSTTPPPPVPEPPASILLALGIATLATKAALNKLA